MVHFPYFSQKIDDISFKLHFHFYGISVFPGINNRNSISTCKSFAELTQRVIKFKMTVNDHLYPTKADFEIRFISKSILDYPVMLYSCVGQNTRTANGRKSPL